MTIIKDIGSPGMAHWYVAPADSLDLIVATAIALDGGRRPAQSRSGNPAIQSILCKCAYIARHGSNTKFRCTAEIAEIIAGVLKRGRPQDEVTRTDGINIPIHDLQSEYHNLMRKARTTP